MSGVAILDEKLAAYRVIPAARLRTTEPANAPLEQLRLRRRRQNRQHTRPATGRRRAEQSRRRDGSVPARKLPLAAPRKSTNQRTTARLRTNLPSPLRPPAKQ